MTTLFIDRFPTPLGELLVISNRQEELCAVDYGDCEARILNLLQLQYANLNLVPKLNGGGFSDRLQAYFTGELSAIEGLPVAPKGSDFQQGVWQALTQIPCGSWMTYGQLAQQLGKPGAARAVGLANSKNPISIVVPCHRVVGAQGKLTGYAGGIERKRWLLEHEGACLTQPKQADTELIQASLF